MKVAASLGAMTSIVLLLVLSSAVAGCSTPMRKTTLIADSVERDSALVNFVRPRVFWGDGVSFDLWDGDTFVGVTSAGSIIQYQTQPGNHVFMIRRESRWRYVKANLAAGKQYFIKVNLGYGTASLGVVHAKEDDRTSVWLTKLQPIETLPEEMDSYASERIEEAREALQILLDGHASYAEMHPEDGI
jgi:hypothetical protein